MLLVYLIVWKTAIVSREMGKAFEGVTSHFHVRKLFRGLLSYRPAVTKVAVNFDSETRNVKDWKIA